MEHAAGDFVSKKLEGEDLGLKQIKVKGGIEEEEGEPLSPMAQMFQEPESNVYIILSVGFKSPIDPFSFKTNLLHTLLNNHPRFSSVQVADEKNGGELKWVQTKVELENHVIIVPMDEGDDMEPKAADKFVEDYISNLTKTNLSMSNYSKNIPMWDCHILNLKTSDEAKSHVVMRVHHSLGDGTSLMSLLLSFSPKLSDPLSFPTFPAPTKKPIPSPTSTLFGACIKIWSIFLLFWNTLVDVLMCVATTYFLKDTQTPLKAPSSAVAFTSRRITVNDVVLAVTQAGLSRYLNRKYGIERINDQSTEWENNNLPHNIRLSATLFMNLRSSPGMYLRDPKIKLPFLAINSSMLLHLCMANRWR